MSDPYCNFYVGQKVIYKPRQPERYERMRRDFGIILAFPIPDQAYHVRAIFMDTGLQRVGLHLVEIVNPHGDFIDGFVEPGFWHGDFRPVTDISELEKLLAAQPTPTPVKQSEPTLAAADWFTLPPRYRTKARLLRMIAESMR